MAEPAIQYPSVFESDGIFGRLPYLLPALFAAAMCVPPLVFAAFQLPETKNWYDYDSVLQVVDVQCCLIFSFAISVTLFQERSEYD